ncbi:MAG: nitrilase-related carbon-nitrogen hydrolase [Solirubrobacteraceae bacterium]
MIACAQLAPILGDLDGNRERAAAAIRRAAAAGAGLIVLPELCSAGYAFSDEAEARALAEPAAGPTVERWCMLAAQFGVVIVGGFCELDDDARLHNSAAVVSPAGVHVIYRKTHLWDREQLIFAAGAQRPPVVDTAVGRIGVAICYDAFFPEVMRGLALDGADLIAVPMNSPLDGPPIEPLAIEAVLAVAAAQVNRVFVAQADRCGDERGTEWAQASLIADPAGRLLCAPAQGERVLTAPCDLSAARTKALGARNDVLGDRRPELYQTDNYQGRQQWVA